MHKVDQFTNNSSVFQLKGSMFTISILHLLKDDPNAFSQQLEKTVMQTPNFFKNLPVIIDLKALNEEEKAIDFATLRSSLSTHGLIPIAVRNGSEPQQQAAVAAGFGVLSNSKSETTQQTPANDTNKPTKSKLITRPIRSGQQVYANNTDLIVLAAVSPGAELLADGHIHVYGTLRGRALAGVSGDKSARIFCQRLEAELVSVAGYYKLHDDINAPDRSQAMQVYLDNDHLCIEKISSNCSAIRA